MSQNPVIRIHLLTIRSYRGFTSLESSLQTCFAITYKKDSTNTGEIFTCIRTVSYLLRFLFNLHEPDLLVCGGYGNGSGP